MAKYEVVLEGLEHDCHVERWTYYVSVEAPDAEEAEYLARELASMGEIDLFDGESSYYDSCGCSSMGIDNEAVDRVDSLSDEANVDYDREALDELGIWDGQWDDDDMAYDSTALDDTDYDLVLAELREKMEGGE